VAVSAVEFLSMVMDGKHPHSLCAQGKHDAFRAVGFFTTADELLDAAAEEMK
jgi:hypothetical protein